MNAAIEATGLGHRYGRRWALRDCTLQIPEHSVVGVVGSNGAGKSTLLHLVVGLLRATAGRVQVLGAVPGSKQLLAKVGFVAQDTPLYRGLTVAETLAMGGWLNPGWDPRAAQARLSRLGIPFEQRVGALSGGQRAQVALALALGKRPELLILDEPVASLDPLARRDFLASVMADVADTGMTVLLSSHVLTDLQLTCDHLVLLSTSRVQLSGDVEDLTSRHHTVTGPRAAADAIAATHTIVQAQYTDRQARMLVRGRATLHDPSLTVRPVTLEELVLAYMTNPETAEPPPLTSVPHPSGVLS